MKILKKFVTSMIYFLMIANFIVELKLKFAIIKKYIIDVTMFIDILTRKFVSSMIYIFIITNFSFN